MVICIPTCERTQYLVPTTNVAPTSCLSLKLNAHQSRISSNSVLLIIIIVVVHTYEFKRHPAFRERPTWDALLHHKNEFTVHRRGALSRGRSRYASASERVLPSRNALRNRERLRWKRTPPLPRPQYWAQKLLKPDWRRASANSPQPIVRPP